MKGNGKIDLKEQLAILEDAHAPEDQKLVASERLVDAGADAIPLLVERLAVADDPIFLDTMRIPTGPMHAGPPVVRQVTVRYQVERMLYAIIYPQPWPKDAPVQKADRGPLSDPAYADVLSPAILMSSRPPLAFVKDWQSWLKTHRSESLEEMRAWSLEEVDRLWSSIYQETSPPPP